MLFNSQIYIFLFLPVVAVVYFMLNRRRLVIVGKAWLVLASLIFYGYWNPVYLLLIISSMLVNFAVGTALHRTKKNPGHHPPPKRKSILAAGVLFNLGLLGFFKYADFFLRNLNGAFGAEVPALGWALPLAISFFTFQQIAYLVDSYQTDTQEYDFLNYCLFVSFFPQLIAGPIVHHREMMPQFMRLRTKVLNWNNVATGVFIFCVGLFKKVVIADSFAVWANAAFNANHLLGFFDAWGASLSYTFQLYYDFSGYTDMAIGAALLFNIRLPVNFNSPYKALSVQDFWRRWHITLSNWLRDYVYIPLGGNRSGRYRNYFNLIITFLLGGLWHGAGWTFVAWGAMHGGAMVIHRFWRRLGFRMPRPAAWFSTFLFINITWVFFRAETFSGALRVLKGMAGVNGVSAAEESASVLNFLSAWLNGVRAMTGAHTASLETTAYIVIFGLVSFLLPNSVEVVQFVPYGGRTVFRPRVIYAIFVGFVLFYFLLSGIQNAPSEFLYFNF